MMNLHCIAIDDEPMALQIIARFCERFGHITLETYTNPVAGMSQVRKRKPDVLLLDIEMGGINGIELAQELPAGVFLIFTTAYAQYAVDGFELNATDFLCKPFSYTRFEKAINKAIGQKKLQQLSAAPVFSDESITLKVEYKSTAIRLQDILYIESMDNYIRVHLVDSPPLMSQISMKSIQELLPSDKFIRIHKSYIVPVHRIASYNSRQLTLFNGSEIPVGRSYSQELRKLK